MEKNHPNCEDPNCECISVCELDCLCNILQEDPSIGPDLEEIGIDFESGIFQSTLNSGFGLNLECDDDGLYTFTGDKNHIPVLVSQKNTARDKYHCNHCDRLFTKLSLVMDHKYKVHNINNQFKCKICTYTGNLYHHLKCHIYRQHSGKALERKPEKSAAENKAPHAYICFYKDCGKQFNKEKDWKKHERVTHAKKDLKCSQCDRTFSMERYRQQHEKTHMRSYSCTWTDCKKTFRDNYNLQCHLRTHTKRKDISCPLCDYTCVQKAALSYHIKKNHKTCAAPTK